MKNKTFSLKQFLLENTISILLLSALFSSVIYIYALSDVFVFTSLTLFSFVYAILLFLVLDFLKWLGKGWISTLVLFVLMIVLIAAGNSLIETEIAATAQWFFDPKGFTRIYVGNIFAVIIMFGFILGAALYYFTRIRFRFVFVFLICMCPFSLFAKSFTDIPVIFTIIIITLFFLLIISKQTDGRLFCGKNRYAAMAAFIVTVSAGAALLPKLEFAPYREEFDELITGINITGSVAADFNGFSDNSSYTKSDDEEEILFRFYGDNPVYLKRQCFNMYNKEKDLWEYYGDVNTGYNYYSDYISWENPACLAGEFGIEMETAEKHTIISSEQGKVHAIYTPENLGGIQFMYSSLSDYSDKNVYRTPVDEYFVSRDVDSYESYSVAWFDSDVDVEFMLMYTDEKAENDGSNYSRDYIKTKNEMRKYHDPLMTEDARKACYKDDKNYERVRKLVRDITAFCTNDYEKAAAIERYFKTSEFVYDDEFSVTDASVENFLFNTKRGICSDYATAMTLMCREAGLYSRYVEGFLVQRIAETGEYIATAADGHAYVQVWLNGYGWTNFDPTSSNIAGGSIDPTFFFVGILMLLIIAGGFVFFFVRPVIAEYRFIRSTSLLRGRGQLIRLYPRISALIHKELRLKGNVLTVKELKTSVYNVFGVDISSLADDYERTVYGDIDCGSKSYMNVYSELKNAVKNKKSEERKGRHKLK